MRMTVLAVAAAFALAACSSSAATEELVGRLWTLESVTGFTTLPSSGATPTIRFAPDGHFSSNTGCNNAGAAYRVEGDNRLVIESMMMTERACADPAGNALEKAYVAAVQRARSFRVTAERLELLDAGGAVLARFR